MAKVIKGKNTRKPYTVRYEAPHTHKPMRTYASGRVVGCAPGCAQATDQRERSFRTKREADDFVAKYEHDRRESVFIDPTLGSITFGEYAQRWIDQHPGAASTKAMYQG